MIISNKNKVVNNLPRLYIRVLDFTQLKMRKTTHHHINIDLISILRSMNALFNPKG